MVPKKYQIRNRSDFGYSYTLGKNLWLIGVHNHVHHHCHLITTPVTFIKSFDCGAGGDLFLEGWKEMGGGGGGMQSPDWLQKR